MQQRALTARPAVLPRTRDEARSRLRLVDGTGAGAAAAAAWNRSGLVLAHRALVVAAASKFRHCRGVELDDLIQEGTVGLLRAADHYDPGRGSFATYARWWVRAYVQLAAKRGAETRRLASLDDGPGPGEPLLSERLPDDRVDLEAQLQRKETESAVRGVLRVLRRRIGSIGQEIVERRICADSPETLEQIGRRWRLSRERIRQIEIRTKLLLKRHLLEVRRESRDV